MSGSRLSTWNAGTVIVYSALIVLMLVVADAVITTSYYSWFDPGLNQIQERFNHLSVDEIGGCVEPEGDDGYGHKVNSVCKGGILAERDAYLKSRHVTILGSWTVTSDFSHDTGAMYIWSPI